MRGKTQNYYTWEYDINKHGEPGGGISETIPDEAMTMREIVERHIRGQQDLTMIKNPGFDPNADLDSMDLEKIPGMDLFDKEEILETIKNDVENQKSFLKEKREKTPPPADASASAPAGGSVPIKAHGGKKGSAPAGEFTPPEPGHGGEAERSDGDNDMTRKRGGGK